MRKRSPQQACFKNKKKSKSIETQANLQETNVENKDQKAQGPKKDFELPTSKPSFDGSMIVDKTYEPLQAPKNAYESRITKTIILLPKLQGYPNPIEEKKRLPRDQQLVQDALTPWEGTP